MIRTLLSVLVGGCLSVGALACQPQGDGAVREDRAGSENSSADLFTPVDLGPWAERIANIHESTVFADVQAHPSRFHRGNVERVASEELELFRRGTMDLVVAKVSTDAPYTGNYVLRDGSEVPAGQYKPAPGEPWAFLLDRFSRLLKTIEDGDALLARSPADMYEARERGMVAFLPGMEGSDGLEGRLDHFREIHERGLGVVQLVHTRPNELAAHTRHFPYSPGGLTEFGREVIREANRLGVIVDVCHTNTQTMREVAKLSEDPMIFSHTGVQALFDREGYLTDEEIELIASTGEVIAVSPMGLTLPTMEEYMSHIDYVATLVGVDHVSIGSDLRGVPSYTEGFGDDANYHAIAAALLQRGYSDEDVGKIMGGNFFRVWREVLG
jgi:microsomal dipeptidase-like Zn-dependent dipeptidase